MKEWQKAKKSYSEQEQTLLDFAKCDNDAGYFGNHICNRYCVCSSNERKVHYVVPIMKVMSACFCDNCGGRLDHLPRDVLPFPPIRERVAIITILFLAIAIGFLAYILNQGTVLVVCAFFSAITAAEAIHILTWPRTAS